MTSWCWLFFPLLCQVDPPIYQHPIFESNFHFEHCVEDTARNGCAEIWCCRTSEILIKTALITMVFEYSHHMCMTDIHIHVFPISVPNKICTSPFSSPIFCDLFQLFVETKKTQQPGNRKFPPRCWGLVLLGRALCRGRLGTRGHFEGFLPDELMGGKMPWGKEFCGRFPKGNWAEIFKVSGSSWNVKYDFLKMIPNDI